MFDEVVKAVAKGKGDAPPVVPYWQKGEKLRYVDLFCGIGGFHQAGDALGMECVFACDIDEEARNAYEHNYGIKPKGDITGIRSKYIPDHDILFSGFPCQPFSIIGSREGFADARGTLFFEIARILKDKSPRAFVLENVKQLATHDKGKTLERILEILRELGYQVDYKIFNALNFGLPQKRERVLIVGFRDEIAGFNWDKIKKVPMTPLAEILEKNPDEKYFVSERIKRSRQAAHTPKITPSIWHENKSGNIASHPFSCALRAGASYNYLLVDGERRLTAREMLRLQGFPDTFEIVCNESQTRKQAGNAVPVPMVKAVLEEVVLNARQQNKTQRTSKAA
jgi:DNA (cytosine-5)-methyltransferase 1